MKSSRTYYSQNKLASFPSWKRDFFISNTPSYLNLRCSIEEHAEYIFNHIYSHGYNREVRPNEIARHYHGLAHVSRAAIYIPVFYHLYIKHGDKGADGLRTEAIKLTQIAALLHDAAREGDGKDYWDNDSGMMVYHYLKSIGETDENAMFLAEAVANKDNDSNKAYAKLHVDKHDVVTWINQAPQAKNIFQKLIHDADCLDIIRARPHFDANYLDFYKQYASKNTIAFDEMALLITEARSLIERQGDSPGRTKPGIKQQYECENGYEYVLADIKRNAKDYPLLNALYTTKHLLSQKKLIAFSFIDKTAYDPTKGLTQSNLEAALREGKIIARGITRPSGKNTKQLTHDNVIKENETLAKTEFRKAARRLGTPTTSSKPNNMSKQGNRDRSVSLLGWGAGVFSSTGMLIINPDWNKVSSVTSKDADTGWGKKREFAGTNIKPVNPTQNIQALIKQLKMGGSSRSFGYQYASTHVELTCDLETYDAIYYSNDPAFTNYFFQDSPEPTHPYSPLLQAVFLQREYEKLHSVRLPIIEYSGLHNQIRLVDKEEYTDEKIIHMWTEIYENTMKKATCDEWQLINFLNKSTNEVMGDALYGNKNNYHLCKGDAAFDEYYFNGFDFKLNTALDKVRWDTLTGTKLHISTWAIIPNVFPHLKNLAESKILDHLHQQTPLNASAAAVILKLLPPNQRRHALRTMQSRISIFRAIEIDEIANLIPADCEIDFFILNILKGFAQNADCYLKLINYIRDENTRCKLMFENADMILKNDIGDRFIRSVKLIPTEKRTEFCLQHKYRLRESNLFDILPIIPNHIVLLREISFFAYDDNTMLSILKYAPEHTHELIMKYLLANSSSNETFKILHAIPTSERLSLLMECMNKQGRLDPNGLKASFKLLTLGDRFTLLEHYIGIFTDKHLIELGKQVLVDEENALKNDKNHLNDLTNKIKKYRAQCLQSQKTKTPLPHLSTIDHKLKNAALAFDDWMKYCVAGHEKKGHYQDHAKALLAWINDNYTGIDNYNDVEQVAAVLAIEYGYETWPAPSQTEFNNVLKQECVRLCQKIWHEMSSNESDSVDYGHGFLRNKCYGGYFHPRYGNFNHLGMDYFHHNRDDYKQTSEALNAFRLFSQHNDNYIKNIEYLKNHTQTKSELIKLLIAIVDNDIISMISALEMKPSLLSLKPKHFGIPEIKSNVTGLSYPTNYAVCMAAELSQLKMVIEMLKHFASKDTRYLPLNEKSLIEKLANKTLKILNNNEKDKLVKKLRDENADDQHRSQCLIQ